MYVAVLICLLILFLGNFTASRHINLALLLFPNIHFILAIVYHLLRLVFILFHSPLSLLELTHPRSPHAKKTLAFACGGASSSPTTGLASPMASSHTSTNASTTCRSPRPKSCSLRVQPPPNATPPLPSSTSAASPSFLATSSPLSTKSNPAATRSVRQWKTSAASSRTWKRGCRSGYPCPTSLVLAIFGSASSLCVSCSAA